MSMECSMKQRHMIRLKFILTVCFQGNGMKTAFHYITPLKNYINCRTWVIQLLLTMFRRIMPHSNGLMKKYECHLSVMIIQQITLIYLTTGHRLQEIQKHIFANGEKQTVHGIFISATTGTK